MKKKATVLVIDGGGRGAVLVDKYLGSPHVGKVLAIPGNDLMSTYSRKPVKIFPNVKTTDVKNIPKIAKSEKVDLVDVAQDDAIAAGVTDTLINNSFRVFGPTKAAGQIEWDKAWARNFMQKFKISSPFFRVCTSVKEGANFIKSQKEGEWFVKASGLTAGKGALYAKNKQEAIEKIKQMKNFGIAGETFLIEECLHGEEFSSFAIVDGPKFVIVGHAQDHKTVYDGNLGPNTGGMGCISPPMLVKPKIEAQIKAIFQKAAHGLLVLKRQYRGILYLGGMVDKKGDVYVIEFNARWGDPEAQVIVPSIKHDLFEIVNSIIDGKINKIKIKKDNFYRIAVTVASRGYPNDYSQVVGKEIFGLDQIIKSNNVKIFGAGIKRLKLKYLALGGRLFYVTAQGKDVIEARQIAYNALSSIFVEGNNLHYRTDIGYRDLERTYQK